MKKIYSLVLLATTLLFSINVEAQVCTLDGVDKNTLLEAFNDANASAAQSHTITLLTDVNIEDPALITNSIATNVTNNWAQQLRILGKDIVLNMNGHSINSSLGFSAGDQYTASGTLKSITKPKSMRTPLFIIYKGSLSIEGTGTINNGIKESGVAVALSGSNVLGTTNFSILTVGKDVTLLGGTTGTGIYIDHHCGTTKKANSSSVIPLLSADELSSLGLSSDVKNCGYGVVINVNGKVYGGVYGIQISGNVSARPTDAELEATKDDEAARAALLVSYPTVHINEGSLVYSEANASSATGIYAAGYGTWTIAGTVQGSTGAYMKSGNVDIVQGAVIESTNTTNYNETVTGKKSGIDAGGSAIVIEATVFYAGGNSLDINGGDIIAASGYAIDENRSETTPVGNNGNNITITAGNFQGGDEGLLKTTDEVKEKIKDNGTISGGVFDDATITEFLPNIDGYIQYADGGDNKYQVVPLPQGEEIQSNPETAADDSYVKMSGTTSFTVESGETRTFAALMLTSDDNVVRVKDGGKLVVSNAATILGNAKIIVEAGGQFIIEGAQGLIADNVNQLILEASDDKVAIFMIHPDVTANTTPSATVNLHAKCYKNGDNYVWQRLGVPAANGIATTEIIKNVATNLQYWNTTIQDWSGVTAGQTLLPFQGLAMTNTASAPGSLYQFPCRLVGNTNGALHAIGLWTSFANSYTAELDLEAMLGAVRDADNGISASAYVYDIPNGFWRTISLIDLEEDDGWVTKLRPLEAFIFNQYAGADGESAINYAECVWNPIYAPTPAPARRGANRVGTKAVITLSSINGNSDEIIVREGSNFTADFDNGCDVIKNRELNAFSIYANTNAGELAAIATDNLNGQNITIASKGETMFKLSFSKVNGEQLAIRDKETGAITEMTEAAEYYFSVPANSVTDRFEIIDVRNAPTALEDATESKNAKGIYSVLGQHIGASNDWTKLPAGIYVINGQKVVK